MNGRPTLHLRWRGNANPLLKPAGNHGVEMFQSLVHASILVQMTQILYAPWRLDYIKTVSDGPKECFLCEAAKAPDKDGPNLVLARTPLCLLMMNKYPYVNGHLLAAPYRHAPSTVECS